MSKPSIVKDFEKLSEEILAQIKLAYPYGFEKKLVRYRNRDGQLISALPFETDSCYYLVRMSHAKALAIVHDDEDYDEEGFLTADAKARIEEELSKAGDEEE